MHILRDNHAGMGIHPVYYLLRENGQGVHN